MKLNFSLKPCLWYIFKNVSFANLRAKTKEIKEKTTTHIFIAEHTWIIHKSQSHGGRKKEEDGSRKDIGCCYEKNGEKWLLPKMETIFQV